MKRGVPTVVDFDEHAIDTLIDPPVIRPPHLCTFL